MDLAEFLNARLDEDEAAAKATTEHAGTADPLTWRRGGGICGAPLASHIAIHDPAHALREIAGKRAILARYEDCLARMEDDAHPQGIARDQARWALWESAETEGQPQTRERYNFPGSPL